jgi:hypothetical protein
MEVTVTTPAAFGRFVRAGSRKYAAIVKPIGYKPD